MREVLESSSSSAQRHDGGRKRKTRGWIDVLAWPSGAPISTACCADELQSCAWVLGWRTITPCGSSSWPLDTIVAAGMIPSTSKSKATQALESEFASVSDRLRGIRQNCCTCCTCNHSKQENKGSSVCTGCIRRTCLEDLLIVALAVHRDGWLPIDNSNVLESKLSVPLICLSQAGRPVAQKTNLRWMGWRQLLLYDDKRTRASDFCLFQSNDYLSQSFFSRTFLARLTHAKIVVDIVTFEETKLESSSVVQPPSCCPDQGKNQESSPSAGDSGDPGLIGLLRMMWNFLRSRSLFIHHLQSVSFIPLLNWMTLFQGDGSSRTGRSSSICLDCQCKRVFEESNYEQAARLISSHDTRVIAAIDLGLGVLIGSKLAFLIWYKMAFRTLSLRLQSHYRFMLSAMDWLERFPIGFKLNVRLTQTMGIAVRSIIASHEFVFERLCVSMGEAHLAQCVGGILLGVAVVFGASGLLALLCDILRLSTLHLSWPAFCFRHVYSTELYLLRALWRLFRGKKRNVLRQRTDTMQYDSTQLLLGTILFTIALFMLTTVLVYHAFFASLNLAILMLTGGCSSLYLVLRRFPWGKLWLRMKRAHWFIEQVYLEDEDSVNDELKTEHHGSKQNPIDLTHLRPVITCLPMIVSEALSVHLQCLLAWFCTCVTQSVTGEGTLTGAGIRVFLGATGIN